jgi:predicted metal-dependent HD superfamily phosphohydrolase
MAAIDLNVGQSRLLQLESRRALLEKHFRQTSLYFNEEHLHLDERVRLMRALLMFECEKLRLFIDKLSEVKSTKAFPEVVHEYRSQERQFNGLFRITHR